MNCTLHTDTPAAAYCRTCGKALCDNCKRDVMGAIYCEPCIAARLQGGQPAAAVVAPATRAATVPSTPSPGLAMLLGFIPGVGAMYNGQFTKAFIHVVLFVLLILATANIAGWIGILIGFAVIYMAFDAYKTAEAKRMGLPLPDPLGLDRMFGLQETQPSPQPAASAGTPASPTAADTQAYVQPARTQEPTPTGAIVLIVLGVIFLLGNFTRVDLHRYWPLILIGLGVWIAYRRMSVVPRGQQ